MESLVISDRIKIFDYQIKREMKLNEFDINQCPSYFHKMLFLETINLTINDFRKIRGDQYWEEKINYNGIDELKYMLIKIRQYKKNIQQ